MVTDKQVQKLFRLLADGSSLAQAAWRTNMDEKTARKYRKFGKRPSEAALPHSWRTRANPFDEVWPTVCELLEANPGLQAKTIFEELNRRYPERFSDSQLRTLQRHVRRWRALCGPPKEVFFAQVHEPGRLCASDFTSMNDLGVTVQGQRFDHLVYHFVLTCSNWESATICFSESFEALSEGLQNALTELGGVPARHRTDRMSTAVNNLSDKKEFTCRYEALLAHYGMTGEKIQADHAHENGDVEQRHHRFKTAVAQALMLRGSRDFAGREDYAVFLRQLLAQLNAGRRERDTPLPTPTGWTTMGEVRVGDEVFDEQGRPAKVTFVSEVQFKEAFSVKFSDGAEIIAGGEHLWTTLNKAAQPRLARIPEDWPSIGQTLTTDEICASLGDEHCIPSRWQHSTRLHYIVAIEPVGIRAMRCIAVDSPSRLYLAGKAMIPTHNTFITAALALKTAIIEAPALVLVMSPSERQSGIFMNTVRDFYAALSQVRENTKKVRRIARFGELPHVDTKADLEWNALPEIDRQSALQLHLDNGSRIIGLPENERTIRGYSGVSLVVIDEASRVADSLYNAVRAVLGRKRGRLVAISTPFGKRGWFWKAWDDSEQDDARGIVASWQRFKVLATDCPHFGPGWLEEERREIGERWFKQEYLCDFANPVDSVFPYEKILKMRDDSIAPLWPME